MFVITIDDAHFKTMAECLVFGANDNTGDSVSSGYIYLLQSNIYFTLKGIVKWLYMTKVRARRKKKFVVI